MSVLRILRYPDPKLREKSRPVEHFAELHPLVEDMIDTMRATPGALGLAAIQIGVPLRVFILQGTRKDVDEKRFAGPDADPSIYVNPEIVASAGLQTQNEGCLSFPEIFYPISRHDKITLRYLDMQWTSTKAVDFSDARNRPRAERTEIGGVARAFQHEMDHLDGALLVDLVGPVKKDIIKRKMTKYNKENS